MLKFIYYILWFISSKFRRIKPSFTSIICIDSSNTYQQIFEKLKLSFRMGARVLRFDGNALEWANDGKNLENILEVAKKIGFASVAIFWNGQKTLKTSANTIFIQFDRLYGKDDDIWNNFIKNLAEIKNKSIYAIFKITKDNYNELEDVLKFIVGNPMIKEIGFTFDETTLNEELKYFVLDKIITFKKRGFQIINSYRSLVNEKQPNKKYKNYTKIFGIDENIVDLETYSSIMPLIEEQVKY